MPRQRSPLSEGQYFDYELLPPPSPEQRAEFIERLMALHDKVNAAALTDRRRKLLQWTHFAP